MKGRGSEDRAGGVGVDGGVVEIVVTQCRSAFFSYMAVWVSAVLSLSLSLSLPPPPSLSLPPSPLSLSSPGGRGPQSIFFSRVIPVT